MPIAGIGQTRQHQDTRNLAILNAFLLAGGGSFLGGPSREEVAWANAPDGRTHAILLETDGGATTPFGYIVELHSVPHDGATPVYAGELYGAARSECTYGVDFHWRNPSTLSLLSASAKKVKMPSSPSIYRA